MGLGRDNGVSAERLRKEFNGYIEIEEVKMIKASHLLLIHFEDQ